MISRPDRTRPTGTFILLALVGVMLTAGVSSLALSGAVGKSETPHRVSGDVAEDPCADSSVPDLLRGVCRSYCEVRDCEGLGRFGSGHVCDTLLQTYVSSTGALPPCARHQADAGALQTPESGDSNANGLGQFNPKPSVAKVSITKERRQLQCTSRTNLCCIEPPQCTCCCVPDTIVTTTVEMDVVTMSARVKTKPNGADLLVVLGSFADPPEGAVPPSGQSTTRFVEMFDSGPVAIGTVTVDGQSIPIVSGDETAGDEIFTRALYLNTSGSNVNNCVYGSDFAQTGHAISIFDTAVVIDATSSATYAFYVEAVDKAGNITATHPMPVAIEGTQINTAASTQACGVPSGNGGCLPGASTDSTR